MQQIEDSLMGTHFLLIDAPAARATVNVLNNVLEFGNNVRGSVHDYPEKGQVSDYLIESTGVPQIYRISVVTSYPAVESITATSEKYYVKDVSPGSDQPDGKWTIDDPVVDSTGAANAKYREEFKTYFRDGSERNEKIVFDANDTVNGVRQKYAEFDIDNPPSGFPEAYVPAYDDTAQWSSKVDYVQTVTRDFEFWDILIGKHIVGSRFYTETKDSSGSLIRTSMSIEKMVISLEKNAEALLSDVPDIIYSADALSLKVYVKTVTLYRIDASGNKTVKTYLYIENTKDGKKYKISKVNSDTASVSLIQ